MSFLHTLLSHTSMKKAVTSAPGGSPLPDAANRKAVVAVVVAQCLLPTMPNVLSDLLPFFSNNNIQCLAHSVANVFPALMPVITLL